VEARFEPLRSGWALAFKDAMELACWAGADQGLRFEAGGGAGSALEFGVGVHGAAALGSAAVAVG